MYYNVSDPAVVKIWERTLESEVRQTSPMHTPPQPFLDVQVAFRELYELCNLIADLETPPIEKVQAIQRMKELVELYAPYIEFQKLKEAKISIDQQQAGRDALSDWWYTRIGNPMTSTLISTSTNSNMMEDPIATIQRLGTMSGMGNSLVSKDDIGSS